MNRRHLLLAAGAVLLKGQQASEFEVASIKPSDPNGRGMRIEMDRGRFTASGMTVKFLIQYGYEVQGFQIQGGPGWIATERYDISAKGGGESKDEDLRPMVRGLLADRFQLTVHRATKELPVYALVVAKGGPKMTVNTSPEDDAQKGTRMSMSRGRIEFQRGSMDGLVNQLAQILGRKVIDKTELTAAYDFKFEWTPDEADGGGMREPGSVQIQGVGPSIFTAIQEQIGLKLESAKGPVEMVVVDRVEKASEN